jgi:hypothetical protein
MHDDGFLDECSGSEVDVEKIDKYIRTKQPTRCIKYQNFILS